MDIFSTIDLSVYIDDGRSACSTTIGAQLCCTQPVVSTMGGWCLGKLVNGSQQGSTHCRRFTYTSYIGFDRRVSGRNLKLDGRILSDGLHHALDTHNHNVGVRLVLEIGCFTNKHAESAIDRKRTSRCGAMAEILAWLMVR